MALRGIARDVSNNNPLGTRYIDLSRKNIAGAYGFTLNVKAQQWDKQNRPMLDEAGNILIDEISSQKIKTGFLNWGKKENCDISAQDNFREIQHLVIIHWKRDGEYLVRKIYDRSKYGFHLQVLDPDIIDDMYSEQLPGGNVVIMGVEYDQWRNRKALYLKPSTPQANIYSYAYATERTRKPIEEFYYDFEKGRAFASRGITPMASALMPMKLLWDYVRAHGSNSINTARRIGFLERKEDAPASIIGNELDAKGNQVIDVEEMSLFEVNPGYNVNVPDNKFPDQQFEMFGKGMKKDIASALRVSYITMANDLTETSYSSGRIGLQDERETWMMDQEWFIESFMDAVFSDWLKSALLSGALDLGPQAFTQFERFNQPYFVGKRWPWIDPAKDATAIETRSRMGLTNPLREAAQNGDNIYELIDEMAKVKKYAEGKGVILDFDSPTVPSADANPSNQTQNSREMKIYLRKIKAILKEMNGELEPS